MWQFFSSKEEWQNGDKNESHGELKSTQGLGFAIQQNENENVVEEELMLLNDAAQFHIPKKYNIPCQEYPGQRSILQGTRHCL